MLLNIRKFLNIKNLIYTIKQATLIAILLTAAEQIFRINNELLAFNLSLKIFAEQFLISFLILSLKNKKAILIIYTVILQLMFFQFVHFNYYGSWIFPMEYILFFTEFDEVVKTFETVLYMSYFPFLITFSVGLWIFLIVKKIKDERFFIPFMSYILIAYMLIIPVGIFIKDSKKGSRPDMERNVLRNGIWTMGYLLGSIIPRKNHRR